MTVRFTIKCPKFPENFKSVPFEEQVNFGKLLQKKNPTVQELSIIDDVKSRLTKTDTLNKRRLEIDDILQSRLNGVEISCGRTFETDGNGKHITGTIDGTIVVSCTNTLAEVEQLIADEDFEIKPDKTYIKHRIKSVNPTNPNSDKEEDIDEVLEPSAIGELKKLKSVPRTNQYKTKLSQI